MSNGFDSDQDRLNPNCLQRSPEDDKRLAFYINEISEFSIPIKAKQILSNIYTFNVSPYILFPWMVNVSVISFHVGLFSGLHAG